MQASFSVKAMSEQSPNNRRTSLTSSESSVSSLFHLKRFLMTFVHSQGCLELAVISLFLAFAKSSVVGVIPDTIADRYARLHHGYSGAPCSGFDRSEKPEACQQGTDDAQAAAAYANVALSMLALVCNPVLGSLSDAYGRRYPFILALVLESLPSLALLMLLAHPDVHPLWYFCSTSLTGIANSVSLGFAALSDVIPEEFRAPAYGVFLAAFYAGMALAPSIPLILSTQIQVCLVSIVLSAVAIAVGAICLPETLPNVQVWVLHESHNTIEQELLAPSMDEIILPEESPTSPSSRRRRVSHRSLVAEDDDMSCCGCLQCDDGDDESTMKTCLRLCHLITRPVHDLSILNRDWTIRLVVFAMLFQSMVYASDFTLFMYYVEDQLNVRKDDISTMFLGLGIAGVITQGVLMQPMQSCFGEKGLLVLTFLSGTLHNFLYGVARNKTTIFWALLLSQLTKLNYPILSSVASKDAATTEQGRIQGALFAVSSIGYALGPLSMEFVYTRTKDNPRLGPGFMFVYAAGLYAIGTVVVAFIPTKSASRGFGNRRSSSLHALLLNEEEGAVEDPFMSSCAITHFEAEGVEDGSVPMDF